MQPGVSKLITTVIRLFYRALYIALHKINISGPKKKKTPPASRHPSISVSSDKSKRKRLELWCLGGFWVQWEIYVLFVDQGTGRHDWQ